MDLTSPSVSHRSVVMCVSLALAPIALVLLGKALGVYAIQIQLLNPSETVPIVVLFDVSVMVVSGVLYVFVVGVGRLTTTRRSGQ